MEIIYYKTKSYGGIDGIVIEQKLFENINIAKLEALKNNWNSGYNLYKVTMTLDGIISIKEEDLGKIECWRDICYKYHLENPEKTQNELKKDLEEQFNSYFRDYDQALDDFRTQRKLKLDTSTQTNN